MPNNTNNYARRLRRISGEVNLVFFNSEEGIPEEVAENPSGWVLYDLPAEYWKDPFRRIGEDADARYARTRRLSQYRKPLPPLQGAPTSLDTPYRRPASAAT